MERNFIGKNIELSTEFSRYLFKNPDFEKKIPLGAEIILLPEFDEILSGIDGVKLETAKAG